MYAAPSIKSILNITERGFTGHEHVDHANVILLDGRVQVAKWGSNDAEISESELSAIRSSLNTLNDSAEYFRNHNNNRNWVRFSLERKLAHEIGHATTGMTDAVNFNVQRADYVINRINGTRRKYYANSSSWCLTCE